MAVPLLLATAVAAGCTRQHEGTSPPAAVQQIVDSIRADGLHAEAPLTLSWTETTLGRWAAVTHSSYRPGIDLSNRMVVAEIDSGETMTCDLCIGSWMGHRPAGRYVIRTSEVSGMGPETIIGPRKEFALDQLGPVAQVGLGAPRSGRPAAR